MHGGEPQSLLPDLSPDRLALQEAIETGLTVHDTYPGGMSPVATALLAQEHGIYTVTEPQDPGTFLEFFRAQARERQLGKLATAAKVRLLGAPEQDIPAMPGYADGTDGLGSKLAEVFTAVTDIVPENIHLMPDGTVAASSITFTVAGEQEAVLLSGALQAFVHHPEVIQPVFMGSSAVEKEGEVAARHTVTVSRLTEYDARIIGSTLDQLMAEEDRAKGVILPLGKLSLQGWTALGITVPANIKERLEAADAAYQALKPQLVSAVSDSTYPEHPGMLPDIDPNLLGTDITPTWQAVRNFFNALIKLERKGSHLNQPQDPDISRRRSIERDVELRRDPATSDQTLAGPMPTRAPRKSETAIDAVRRALKDAKRAPLKMGFKASIKLAKAVLGGVPDVIVEALDQAPNALSAVQLFARSRQEWKHQKRVAFAAHQRVVCAAYGITVDELASYTRAHGGSFGSKKEFASHES